MVPVSLCFVLVLSSFGPWGAANVSRTDQLARLRRLLERHALLQDGKVRRAVVPVDFASRKSIRAGLDYLNRVHRGAGLHDWFEPETLRAWGKRARTGEEPVTPRMIEAMGLVYESSWQNFGFYANRDIADTLDLIPMAGYQVMAQVRLFRQAYAAPRKFLVVGERRFAIGFEDSGRVFRVSDARSSVALPLVPLIQRLRHEHPPSGWVPSPGEMTVEAEGTGLRCKLVITQLSGRIAADSLSVGGDTIEVDQIDGAVFLRLP